MIHANFPYFSKDFVITDCIFFHSRSRILHNHATRKTCYIADNYFKPFPICSFRMTKKHACPV